MFRNSDARPLLLLLPEHLGMIPFPNWTFRAQDGTEWVPHRPSFQSMWQLGIQGGIQKIAPGGRHVVTFKCRGFEKGGPDDGRSQIRDTARHLPPGTYDVTASHTQKEATIPFSRHAFEVSEEPYPGLWTGTVSSASIQLEVLSAQHPSLELTVASKVKAGEYSPATVILAQPIERKLGGGRKARDHRL